MSLADTRSPATSETAGPPAAASPPTGTCLPTPLEDASAVAGYVGPAGLTAPGSPAADLVSGDDAVFHVPSIFDAEVLSALRGLVRGGKFDGAAATELVADLLVLPVDR